LSLTKSEKTYKRNFFMEKLTVVAFGGNALLRGDQIGTIDEQEQNVYETCQHLVPLVRAGYNIVIGHGNGPQVGNVLLQHEAGKRLFGLPTQPMDFCVAETQGSIGFMIEQQMRNVLAEHGLERNIVAIITQVMVDRNDPAFKNPAKPVGPFYTKEEADSIIEAHPDWVFHEDPRKRGWRRVVASPRPLDIPNWKAVERLARKGTIVVTVGGGGIAAYRDEKGKMVGIDAVIDKDLACSLLANKINADEFCILTDVSNVFIDFHKPNEKKLEKVSVKEIKMHLADGQFAEGSMAPKVRACVEFVENGGQQAVITEAEQMGVSGKGTVIHA
jgi:carbamate kinase